MEAVSGSLDANILLRLLLNDVSDQHRAVEALLGRATGKFEVADTAIIETVFVLDRHYGLTRPQAIEAIEGIMALVQIRCNHELFSKALPLYAKCPKLSFEDCCLSAYAELNHAEPLWTFDIKLAHQSPNARLVPNSP